jgi:hypothetical protein
MEAACTSETSASLPTTCGITTQEQNELNREGLKLVTSYFDNLKSNNGTELSSRVEGICVSDYNIKTKLLLCHCCHNDPLF